MWKPLPAQLQPCLFFILFNSDKQITSDFSVHMAPLKPTQVRHVFKETWVRNKISMIKCSFLYVLPFCFVAVLHYSGKIKPLRCDCSLNKMPLLMCIFKISFHHDKSCLCNDIRFYISLFKQGQTLLWMLWNVFSLSLRQFSLISLTWA